MRKPFYTITVVLAVAMVASLFIACGGGGGGSDASPSPASFMAVALRGAGQIAIVDLSDNSIAATYDVGTGPQSIDITPDGQFFYIVDNEGSESDGPLWVVDVATGAVTDSVDLGGGAWGVKVHPNGSKVYVAVQTEDYIAVVDTATNSVANTIAVGDKPTGLAISPDGSMLCVPNHGDDTLSLVDTVTETVLAVTAGNVPGDGGEPWEVSFSPNGQYCWTGDGDGGDTISVYSTSTYALAASTVITVNEGSPDPVAVLVDPDGQRVYVAMQNSLELVVMNASTYAQMGTIATSTSNTDNAKRLAVDGVSDTLYYSSDYDDLISVIDLTTNTETDVITFSSGDRPNGMVLY